MDRRAFLGGMAAIIVVPARAGGALRVGGAAFGSSWRLTAPSDADGPATAAALRRVIAGTDASMSPWRSDSELSRFNRAEAGFYPASAPLRAVSTTALDVARATGGAFDPTVGPLVRRFGWGPISGGAPGYEAVSLADGGLEKHDASATLDLCGVAKGHALDLAIGALAGLGVAQALIEMGGEVRALGVHPSGRPWRLAVEAPGHGSLAVQHIVEPGRLALATSGLSPNGYAQGGRSTSHILDPRSGRPVPGRLAQVTVAAETAGVADAWATALLVLGPDAGPEMAERRGLTALFLIRDGDGVAEILTGGFNRLVVA